MRVVDLWEAFAGMRTTWMLKPIRVVNDHGDDDGELLSISETADAIMLTTDLRPPARTFDEAEDLVKEHGFAVIDKDVLEERIASLSEQATITAQDVRDIFIDCLE